MSRRWTEDELIIAFALYCQFEFGKIHHRNPKIIKVSNRINRTPSALSMKMANFASLDPIIIKSGRSGLGNASKKDKEIWDKFHENWEYAVDKAEKLLDSDFLIKDAVEDFSSDDKIAETKIRRRQSFFRNSILSNYRESCCISGLNYSKFLIASHIKPWSKDKKNRLNPRNGLCLSVLYDKAFDLGLITILPEYDIQVSETLKENATDSFSRENLHSIDGKRISLPEKFLPSQEFLEYHNKNIYLT
jgi:hypothetical protein